MAATVMASAPAQASSGQVAAYANLDVEKYLGQWYQIADIPQFYDIACTSNTIATYSLNADGTIKVFNRCTNPFGGTSTITGAAKPADQAVPAALTVSFLNFFGKQLYAPGANYVVMDVAPDYSWAVVGHPDHQSAYILSRQPSLSADKLAAAKSVLTQGGYDLCALRFTPQTGGSSSTAKLC
jgi:apolipoprotein D and lipocalin family protein